jgi:hypothetical protein
MRLGNRGKIMFYEVDAEIDVDLYLYSGQQEFRQCM